MLLAEHSYERTGCEYRRCCEDAQLYFTVNCCVSAAGAFGNPAATVRQASIFVGGLSPTEENNSNQLTGEHISLNRHGFKLASANYKKIDVRFTPESTFGSAVGLSAKGQERTCMSLMTCGNPGCLV